MYCYPLFIVVAFVIEMLLCSVVAYTLPCCTEPMEGIRKNMSAHRNSTTSTKAQALLKKQSTINRHVDPDDSDAADEVLAELAAEQAVAAAEAKAEAAAGDTTTADKLGEKNEEI